MVSKGGRGKKAPYKTTVVRVPVPVVREVESIVYSYRESVETGSEYLPMVSREKMEDAIAKVLKSKKSAKVSMMMLVSHLWGG